MNKHRFLEDAVEWLYNVTMAYKYDGDTYGSFLVVLILLFVAALIILGLIAWLIYDFIDKITATSVSYTGILIDKKYIGESDSSGVGTAVVNTTSGVGVGLVSTSSHSPEEFLFFINADKVYKCPVDMQNYYRFKTGDTISFSVLIGGKSKDELKIRLA